MKKDIRRMIRIAEKQGWIVEHRKGGHILFFPPEKEYGFVTVSGSTSDHKALKNIRSYLKGAGLKL